jgi:hypothetical protein
VCVFAYSSRTDTPICNKLIMLNPLNQEEILERLKLLKSVLGSKPGEGGFKTVPYSSLSEDVGFSNNDKNNIFPIIFNDAYRTVRPTIISFRAMNIGKKYKHLSNFPAVTLRTLC